MVKFDPRVYITGASCAGVTTLGDTLARRLDVRHVDVDAFYWMPTATPFTVKRPPEERRTLIREACGPDGWVLTGSFDGWGDALIVDVDLIAFVVTPTPIRMERLIARERQRYGDRILPGGDMHEIHRAFAEWAAQYDAPGPEHSGRNRGRHENWLSEQQAPVLRLDGTTPPQAMADQIVAALSVLR
jgi:adenylate kinase family enzyme